jgi:hypothetical protein
MTLMVLGTNQGKRESEMSASLKTDEESIDGKHHAKKE